MINLYFLYIQIIRTLHHKNFAKMKWNFFNDENEGKSYKSTEDWYNDIKHLFYPSLIILILLILLLLFLL
jgi:hypothetical protein